VAAEDGHLRDHDWLSDDRTRNGIEPLEHPNFDPCGLAVLAQNLQQRRHVRSDGAGKPRRFAARLAYRNRDAVLVHVQSDDKLGTSIIELELVHCVIDLAPGEFDGKDRHIST
jgi:hypothetical protein